MAGHTIRGSSDHLGGLGDHRWWDGEAERPGHLQVGAQVAFEVFLDRQAGWLQDAVADARAPMLSQTWDNGKRGGQARVTMKIEALPVPLRADEHGVVRVGDTSIPIDRVVYAFNQGATPEQIVYSFDTLQLADVYAVIAYYLHHRAAVDAYLQQQERKAAELRHEVEARWDPGGIRERLLARRARPGS